MNKKIVGFIATVAADGSIMNAFQ